MRAMLTQAKSAGVHPILVTPISRAGTALESQHVNSTGANLPQIIRDLGEDENVPVIDLTVATGNWLETIDWTQYFALGTDKTHPNPEEPRSSRGSWLTRSATRISSSPSTSGSLGRGLEGSASEAPRDFEQR